MLQVLRNAFAVKDIRTKILYTLLLLLIYRLGCFIPVPGVDAIYISSQVSQYSILGYVDLLGGGALSNFTIMAMGITPYINASIIMNLLTIAIPALERMAKEGEDGRKKIEKITRYAAVGLAFVQAIGITLSFGEAAVMDTGFFSYLMIGLVITSGSAFLMWVGERINELGIGNGISLLIFTSIISKVPSTVIGIGEQVFSGLLDIWIVLVIVVLLLVLIAGVTFIDLGMRRVPVQYAKRVVGRKMYGGQSTHIPMRVNSTGVMPLIFAMTIIQFPGMIAQFWPSSGFTSFYYAYLADGTVVYFAVYFLLIIAFAFFYSSISFNPVEISRNMQQHGGFIPGIRPGRPTSDYLKRISSRLTLFGALFLAVIASVPTLFSSLLGSQTASAFGATSILIMVSVALETSKQLEAQLMMRHYKGFLK